MQAGTGTYRRDGGVMMNKKVYTCADCGKENIRPFSNGDGKVKCEECAVKEYKKLPFSLTQPIWIIQYYHTGVQ